MDLKRLAQAELSRIVELHEKWLNDEPGGERANLEGAYLEGTDLEGTDLRGAYLRGAKYGDSTITIEPLQILGLRWDVIVFDEHLKIGCQIHPIERWKKFTDNQIATMDPDALEFWSEHKKMLISIAEMHSRRALAVRDKSEEER